MSDDYYDILGVKKDATKAEIKKAYKKLAKKYHPDRFQSESDKKKAEVKFKEINEAASVLGDDSKRQQYNQFGKAGAQGASRGGFNYQDFGGFNNFGGDFDFGDIFDMFFGGGGGRSRGRKHQDNSGSDLRFDLTIALDDVATGIEKTIVIPRLLKCKTCNGKGTKNSEDVTTCSQCRGSGRVVRTRRTPFGMFQTTATCDVCSGEGQTIKNPCSDCNGSGRSEQSSKVKIKIPAGVHEGTRLRISNEGEAGVRGGPSGDLYVIIHVRKHKFFVRDEDDLYIEIPISFTQAALGDIIEVPVLGGSTKLKIPTGTQTETIFRIKGKGIPHLNSSGSGDQNVRVTVDVPKKLNKKQKEILEAFAKASGESSNPVKGFIKKIFDKL